MIRNEVIQAMIDAGASREVIAAAVMADARAEKAEADARDDRRRALTRARVAKHRASGNACNASQALQSDEGNEGNALPTVTLGASPAPCLDGRPSPPAPPHPTLNPSPTPESQIGASALGDESEGQGGKDPEAGNPVAATGKRVKADKPRMNEWPEDFREQFWEVYPRKVAKKPAMKELERIYLADKVPFLEIIEGVKLLSRLGLDPEYIKHPDSWLRNERWNDDQSSRLNSRKSSTNSQNGMTLASQSKSGWLNDAKAADERLREKANGQRNDRDPAPDPSLDHEPRPQPGAAAEPRSCQRPDAGRPGAAGGSGDGRRSAFASLPARIPGW